MSNQNFIHPLFLNSEECYPRYLQNRNRFWFQLTCFYLSYPIIIYFFCNKIAWFFFFKKKSFAIKLCLFFSNQSKDKTCPIFYLYWRIFRGNFFFITIFMNIKQFVLSKLQILFISQLHGYQNLNIEV